MTESLPPASSPGVILLRPDRFVARHVRLVPGTPVAAQVELALENFAPFPLDQLYYGYVTSPAQDEALVFAARRKQFSAEETADWDTAALVVPAFAGLLAEAPAAPAIRVWHGAESATAVAWDGRSALPAALVTRPGATAGETALLLAELRARTGRDTAPLEEITGEPAATRPAGGRAIEISLMTTEGARSATLGPGEAVTADVREKGFLAERRRTGRRDQGLWRVFVATLLGLAALLVLELGLFGARGVVRRQRADIAARAAAVEKIATAQSLSERIAELAKRRLMPFEMLMVLNRYRPPALSFVRAATAGRLAFEIEVQTPNASEAGAYESALRAAPELASVETRDLRARDGLTSFTLVATFKPDGLLRSDPP